MNILVALPRFPHPITQGDRLRAYYLLRELAKRHRLHLVCLAETPPTAADREAIAPLVSNLEVFPHPLWRRGLGLVRAAFNRLPAQVNYFHSPPARQRLHELAHSGEFDAGLVQLVRMAGNWPAEAPLPAVLDFIDALSAAMERRTHLAPAWQRPLLRLEAQRLAAFEEATARRFAATTIISEADRLALPAQARTQTHIVPNGLADHFLQQTPPAAAEKDIDLIFTGNLSYFPNVEAATFLAEQVMPRVWASRPEAKLYLVGTSPSPAVRSLQSAGITVTGFVPSMSEYLRRARLFAAPLFAGGGLQNKLLEAMAVEVPVLTTPHANLSLGGVDGETLRLAEDAPSFADRICELLAAPQAAAQLGQAGQRHVRNNFRWETATAQLEAVLQGVS